MATATNINGWNVGGNNNSFDQRGHFYRGVFSGNVSGMLVKQNSTPNMTVVVEHGSALLNKNSISASIAEIKSDTSVTIDTANTSNPRIDSIVIYEDTSIAIPTVEADYWQDGAEGRFKVVSLPGTAAASPVALSDANIQSAIGAGKPWTRLADITVPANSTTILNSNIADRRAQLGGTVPDKSITASKIDLSTFMAPAEAIGNDGSGSNNVTLVTLNFPFVAGRRYLILGSCARVDRAAAGIIQTELRVGTNAISRVRTFGGSNVQMGVSMQRLYTPATTSTQSVNIFVRVLTGGNGFDYEFPVISVVPLPSSA